MSATVQSRAPANDATLTRLEREAFDRLVSDPRTAFVVDVPRVTSRKQALSQSRRLLVAAIMPSLRLPHPRFDAKLVSRLMSLVVTTMVAAVCVGIVAGNFNLPSFAPSRPAAPAPVIAGSITVTQIPPLFGTDDQSLATAPRVAPSEIQPTVKTATAKVPATVRNARTVKVAAVAPSRSTQASSSARTQSQRATSPRTRTVTRTAPATQAKTQPKAVAAPVAKPAVVKAAVSTKPAVKTSVKPVVAHTPAKPPVVAPATPTITFVGSTAGSGTTGSPVVDQGVAGGAASHDATPVGSGNAVSLPPIVVSD